MLSDPLANNYKTYSDLKNLKILYYNSKINNKIKFNYTKIPSFNFISRNYIYYADYCSKLGLINHPYGTRSKIIERCKACIPLVVDTIQKFKPDIVYYETIDRPEIFIASIICSRQKIPAIEARFYGANEARIYPATGIMRKNPIYYLRKKFKIYTKLKSIKYSTAHSQFLKTQNQFPKIKTLFHKKYYLLKIFFQLLLEKKYLCTNYKKHNKKINILFFPLNHLPEASTFSEAPNWSDPHAICLRLSAYLPNDWEIWVKEHPRTLYKRPLGFYKNLSKLPGITIFHPNLSIASLLRQCTSCLVVTSTVGLVAHRFRKIVGILGRPAWVDAPWIVKLDKPENIYNKSLKKFPTKTSKEWLHKFENATWPLSKAQLFSEPSFGQSVGQMIRQTEKILND